MLRAVLSAQHAAQIDWSQLTPSRTADAFDVWWLQGAFASVGDETQSQAAHDEDGLRSQLDLASAHLDEALAALSCGEIGIGRSQFRQFFDAWDGVDERIGELYPARYEVLDVELERAEIALLHKQPEDVDAARLALQNIRADLAEITHDLQR